MITCESTYHSFLFNRLQQNSDLLAQFRVVCVTVTGDGVIDGSLKHFILGAFEPQSATAIARMIAAINRFSFRHDRYLWFSMTNFSLSIEASGKLKFAVRLFVALRCNQLLRPGYLFRDTS